MERIQIKDKFFKIKISSEEISASVKEIANLINEDFKDKNPLFLVMLNGAFIFAADLLRHIHIPCSISFIKYTSYNGISSTGEIKEILGLDVNISGRNVVIVEDIVDTGISLSEILPLLREKHALSIHITALLSKPSARKKNIDVDYLGFEIPTDFVVGYGLDYDGEGRNLTDIYSLEIPNNL